LPRRENIFGKKPDLILSGNLFTFGVVQVAYPKIILLCFPFFTLNIFRCTYQPFPALAPFRRTPWAKYARPLSSASPSGSSESAQNKNCVKIKLIII